MIAESNVSPPQSMVQSFDVLRTLQVISSKTCERMQKAVGFRNISVHEYQSIDWLIVFKIITQHLGNFKGFAREVSVWDGNGVKVEGS